MDGAIDYRLVDVPGYLKWSERKLAEGGNEALIAHLDATGMFLRPEEFGKITEADFEEMLDDLRAALARDYAK
jgi:hypothetical protein